MGYYEELKLILPSLSSMIHFAVPKSYSSFRNQVDSVDKVLLLYHFKASFASALCFQFEAVFEALINCILGR